MLSKSLTKQKVATQSKLTKLQKQIVTKATGGDDYELCFTISNQNYEKLLQLQPNVKTTIIGTVKQQYGLTFEKDGLDHSLQFNGYQHFA